MIEELMVELERLRSAEKLLERVWNSIGPYPNPDPFCDPKGHLGMPDKQLHSDIRKFFKFDDSE